MAAQDDGFVDPVDRPILHQLASDPITEQVWAAIEKSCGPQMRVTMRFFIREVLGAKRIAAAPNEWPDYLRIAKKTGEVADLLKASWYLMALKDISDTVTQLESIASRFRELDDSQRVRPSRQNAGGSREINLFVSLVSMSMNELFGRPLDGQVADLTNILFPEAHATTTDSVRGVRRPRTKKRRLGKQ